MKNSIIRIMFLLVVGWLLPLEVWSQQIVREYKIQNLISEVVLQQFQQINQNVDIYEHKEGNRLILVGQPNDIVTAIEQLELLDTQQMMITIDFMLVEYFHERDFDWGIDITRGTTGNFNNIGYTPGTVGSNLSFAFDALTKLTPNFQVNIRALVSNGKAKILTNPHVVVESGREANLNIKDRRTIVLETATINGVTTTLQNIEAGIDLRVTPVSTHDSLIHLNVQGVISEFLPFSNAGEFLIEENSIFTQVDVKSGHTLILGGLILEQTNVVEGGTPGLRKVPLLGLLFRTRREIKNYVERVLYITPYLHPVADIGEYEQIRKMTPFENEVEKIIEQDPEFLKYRKTKQSMKRNRKESRRNRNEPPE